MNDILVLGVGNLLMQDEGVGIHAIRALEERYQFEPAVDLVDGGTAGLELIDKLDGREKVLIVDAVDFDLAPGSIVKLGNGQVQSQLKEKMSLHHLGLTDVLSAAELLDIRPPAIHLIGVQPDSMEVALELSPKMRSVFPQVLEAVVAQLGEWGVEAVEATEGIQV
ncbi:MAG: HyaD/HybD family hydrogenase maturation endopeptidase [Candidatus Marinimicrobia bacterium]|nr:HyaD/HybD family hydrogenase maturation endopeptidase [Candidatus Neomarinimicrobiota bacterium]MCF7828469.1 HyaD/HybD family hydrogenase maturation endopeptidase [Candidatus Neomarinimicrobiota bacterium]MCF7881959.1 HyaD/HybD family hydrogenase maturation endopeptidase [Candidatus Neomarinimicrobiota bacterium]